MCASLASFTAQKMLIQQFQQTLLCGHKPTQRRLCAANTRLNNQTRRLIRPQPVAQTAEVATAEALSRLNTATQQQQQQQQRSADVTSTSSSLQDRLSDGFKWESYWYPVHVLESIDPSRPHALQLLGKQLVLWRDGQGKWQCMEDACPHRLAPLSEGRVQDGALMCSYHGWKFGSDGKCTDIPQALDEKAKATACSSSRSCVTTYPVREAYGLIWVWPSAGPAAAAEAAAAPVPLSKGVLKAAEGGQYLRWYRRELEYSWDCLIENLCDPSHLPFSHHNLLPSMNRKHGKAMPFKAVQVPTGNTPEDAAARPDYCLPHQAPVATFEFPSAQSPNGIVCFHPPVAVVYEYSLAFMGPYSMQNDLLAVPSAPGKALVFTLGTSNTPTVSNADLLKAALTNIKTLPMMMMRAHFQRRPTYSAHLLANKLFDQDNVFLAMQDRQIALRGKDNWQKDYYMPTPCDGLVIAARKWASEALQLHVPGAAPTTSSSNGSISSSNQPTPPTAAQLFSLSAEAAAASPQPSPRTINDRLKQHTQHCVICQKALQQLQWKLKVAQAAAAAALAGLIGLLSAVVLPGIVAKLTAAVAGASAGAAGVGVSGAAAAATAWGPVAAAAGVLGLIAAVAAAVAKSTAALAEQFVYVEFSHAHND